jgi:hypothetical protein
MSAMVVSENQRIGFMAVGELKVPAPKGGRSSRCSSGERRTPRIPPNPAQNLRVAGVNPTDGNVSSPRQVCPVTEIRPLGWGRAA